MPFCQRCGNKADDNDVFCKQCGTRLVPLVNENKSSYNKWVRAFSVIWGTLILLGSIASGIPYYFKSGLPLVIISEILLIPISISLILLGLFPEYINNKIQIKDKYPEIIVGITIVFFIVAAIQPEPPGGWWNYTP